MFFRKIFFLSLFVFFFVFSSKKIALAKSPITFNIGIDSSHRVDHLDWNIAGDGNGQTPNVLSELTWDEIEIAQLKGSGRLTFDLDKMPFSLYARGSVAYGRIYDGVNQDSDYGTDNRTSEFSRSNNRADDGSVFENSIGIGFQFNMRMGDLGERIEISPLIGYSNHEQNLTMTDGNQTVSEPSLVPSDIDFTPPDLGRFSSLDSSYKTRWKGPWVGIDISFNNDFRQVLSFLFEYHWADYYAEADWNLVPEFLHPKSFEQDAEGTGYIASIGWQYLFNPHWSLSLGFDLQEWSTEAGTDTTFFSDGTIGLTRLNKVNWDSESYSMGLQYRF